MPRELCSILWRLVKLYSHGKPAAHMLATAAVVLLGTACGPPAVSSMVSDVSPGVVQIVTPSGTGSGFIISSSEVGLVLRGGPGVLVITNAHVVLSYDTVDIRLFDGHSYEGSVVNIDESTDLALIVLRASRDFEPVSLGNSYSVAVGEDVVAIGFPSGDTDIPLDSPTITRGIVSAKRVSASGVGLLQTDAAINPGNSGGPLFDRDGRVIGVNTSKVFESTDGRPVEGIGLAVAVNEVSHWFESIRNLIRSGPDSLPDPTPGEGDIPGGARAGSSEHTGLGVSLRTVQSELSHFDFSPPEMRPDGQPFVIGRKHPDIAVYTAEIVQLFLIGDAEDLTIAAVVFSTSIDPIDGMDVARFIQLLAPGAGGAEWVSAGLRAGWDWDGFDDMTRDLDGVRIEAMPLPLDRQLAYLSTLHPDGSWRFSPQPVFLMVRFIRH